MKEKYELAKKLNLAAGIIDIIIGSFVLIGLIYLLTIINAFAGLSGTLGIGFALIFSVIIEIILIGCLLGFGIATICFGKVKGQKYCEKKGSFLGFAIVETIVLVFEIATLATSFDVVSLIAILIMAVVLVLRYTAYAYIKKVSGKLEDSQEPENVEQKNSIEKEINLEKIQRLVDLKNSGAITEEEFEQLKKKELGL